MTDPAAPTTQRSVVPWLRGSERPLDQAYDVALIDLDGVVYVGRDEVPGAARALARVRRSGMRIAFVTNNASRSPEDVATHLSDLGIEAVPEDVVTSSQAAVRLVHDRLGPSAAVLVAGSRALHDAAVAAGLRPVDSADDRPDAVVQGFDAALTYADLAEAALAVRAGALWVATNTDTTLPSPRGLLPGNGSLVALVATATGASPIVAGKPARPLHAEAVRRTAASCPLVVGDRLETDIEGANAAGADSLLVLTGVTGAGDLVRARPEHRPTYLAADLAGLLQPQPDVVRAVGETRCRGWVARSGGTGDAVRLDGGGDPVDGLRALLALVWARAERTPAPETAEAVAHLGLP